MTGNQELATIAAELRRIRQVLERMAPPPPPKDPDAETKPRRLYVF